MQLKHCTASLTIAGEGSCNSCTISGKAVLATGKTRTDVLGQALGYTDSVNDVTIDLLGDHNDYKLAIYGGHDGERVRTGCLDLHRQTAPSQSKCDTAQHPSLQSRISRMLDGFKKGQAELGNPSRTLFQEIRDDEESFDLFL